MTDLLKDLPNATEGSATCPPHDWTSVDGWGVFVGVSQCRHCGKRVATFPLPPSKPRRRKVIREVAKSASIGAGIILSINGVKCLGGLDIIGLSFTLAAILTMAAAVHLLRE